MSDWFWNTDDRDADLSAQRVDYMDNKGLRSGMIENSMKFDLDGELGETEDNDDRIPGDIASHPGA